MSKICCICLIVLFSFLSCTKDTLQPEYDELFEKLQALPGVEVVSFGPFEGYPKAYVLKFTQPVDHNNPAGRTFVQIGYLMHKSESAPMVFAPWGYTTMPTDMLELTLELDANQLTVSHRYFKGSRPDPPDWQYLTVEQAAADHHHIVSLLQQIYTGVWLSSGWGKGGQAALFHRRFYPDDVQATLTYAAPILLGLEDPRCQEHLYTLGDEGSWEKIHRFQRKVLEKRDMLIPLIDSYFSVRDYRLSLHPEVVLESAVVSYPAYLWTFQDIHHHRPSTIPDTNATVIEMYEHLTEVIHMVAYCDSLIEYFEPAVYQSLTELGGGLTDTEHLDDLLQVIHDVDEDEFAPDGADLTFKPEVMQDISQWLQTQGNNIVYIYGGYDSYAGASVELTGQTNALKIIQPGAGRGVRIHDLDSPDIVYTALEEWLGIEIH